MLKQRPLNITIKPFLRNYVAFAPTIHAKPHVTINKYKPPKIKCVQKKKGIEKVKYRSKIEYK